MHTITATRTIAAPAERVWQVLRDFDSLARWHPDVTASRLDGPQRIGCIRSLTLNNGGTIREQLDSVDDEGRRTSYRLLTGPLPVSDYLGTLSVHQHAEGCVVEWTSAMTIAGGDPAAVADILHTTFSDGLAGLDALVSGRPA